jgi:hypothetical protein
VTDEQFDKIIAAIERLTDAIERQMERMPPRPPEMFADADGRVWYRGNGGGSGGT